VPGQWIRNLWILIPICLQKKNI